MRSRETRRVQIALQIGGNVRSRRVMTNAPHSAVEKPVRPVVAERFTCEKLGATIRSGRSHIIRCSDDLAMEAAILPCELPIPTAFKDALDCSSPRVEVVVFAR